MLLSIIIPVYNLENYLEKCINSIVNQEFEGYEVILIDDGSIDGSGEICDKYVKKYRNFIVKHIENQGVSHARNIGLELAKGQYIWFIDGDDYVEVDSLKKIYKYLQENVETDLLIFDVYVRDNNQNIKRIISREEIANHDYKLNNNKELVHFNTSLWNKIYNKKIIEKNKLFFNEKLSIAEDLLFNYIYILKCTNVVYHKDKLYNYIERKNSAMQGGGRDQDVRNAFDFLIEYYKKHAAYDEYKKEIEYLTYNHVYLVSTIRIIRSKSNDKKKNISEIKQWIKEKKMAPMIYNKYIWKMPKKHIALLIMIKLKCYWLIELLFRKRTELIK